GQGADIHAWLGGEAKTFTPAQAPTWHAGKVGSAVEVSPNSTLALGALANSEKTQAFSVSGWVFVPGNSPGGSILSRMEQGPNYRGWDVHAVGNDLMVYLVSK